MKRENLLLKNTIIISFGTFFPKFVGLVTLPIITGYLTKEELGQYDLITVLISLVLPVLTLQIQTAAFRFLINNRKKKEEICIIVSTIFYFTIIVSIISVIIAYTILTFLNVSGRLWILTYFLLDIIYQTFQQFNRGLGDNLWYSVNTIILSSMSMVGIVLLVLYKGRGLIGVLTALIIANFAGIAFTFIRRKYWRIIRINCFSKLKLKELIMYSWPLIPNNLSSWVMTLSDRMVLTMVLGFEVNAVYAVAKKIPNLITAVQSTFSLAWQENATIFSKEEDAEQYYSNVFDSVFSIVAGITALLISIAPFLFALLVRGDYKDAFFQMPLLFIALFFTTLSSFLGGIYVQT